MTNPTPEGNGTERRFLVAGACSGLVSVVAGAFAAHTLRPRLPPELLAAFETGARYQMYHALGLLAVAWAASRWPGRAALWSGRFFLLGTILFSGSLYALALTGIRWLGAVTPVGGLCFMAGWLCLAFAPRR